MNEHIDELKIFICDQKKESSHKLPTMSIRSLLTLARGINLHIMIDIFFFKSEILLFSFHAFIFLLKGDVKPILPIRQLNIFRQRFGFVMLVAANVARDSSSVQMPSNGFVLNVFTQRLHMNFSLSRLRGCSQPGK